MAPQSLLKSPIWFNMQLVSVFWISEWTPLAAHLLAPSLSPKLLLQCSYSDIHSYTNGCLLQSEELPTPLGTIKDSVSEFTCHKRNSNNCRSPNTNSVSLKDTSNMRKVGTGIWTANPLIINCNLFQPTELIHCTVLYLCIWGQHSYYHRVRRCYLQMYSPFYASDSQVFIKGFLIFYVLSNIFKQDTARGP